MEPNDARHAAHVEPELKKKALTRLKRIEGQVRGIQSMVDDERYCGDVLVQIASVHEALRGVEKLLMRNHLRHCISGAVNAGDGEDREKVYGELLDLMYRHAR